MGAPPLAPLVVGVTGHRDLRDEDRGRLRMLVGRELDRLLGGSPATPLMILSPLADGADRLVAREGLYRGARLVVLLPMEQRFYEEDFETEESLLEFRKLLSEAEAVVTLPPAEGRSRQYAYALVGACVARHSHALLALWDGKQAGGTGGTAQIVDFQRSGRFEDAGLQAAFQQLPEPFGPGSDPLSAPEPGLVIQILTPRRGRALPEGAFEVLRLGPDKTPIKLFSKALQATRDRLHEFNADIERLWRTTDDDERATAKSLVTQDEDLRLPCPLRRLHDQQTGADLLAQRFQRQTKQAAVVLSAVVFLAAIAFAHHSTLVPTDGRKNPWALALYLGFLAAAAGIHALSSHRNDHSRFLDYRAVAEGLRVQFYWRLAGLDKAAADHYLRWQRNELDWIRNVLRAWAFPLLAAPRPSGMEPMLRQRWIQGQWDYFKKREPQKRRQRLRLTSVRNTLVLLSLGVAAFEVFHQPESSLWAKGLTALVCLGASATIWKDLKAFRLKVLWKPDARESNTSILRGTLDAFEGFLCVSVLLGGLWSWAGWEQVDPRRLDLAEDAWRMVVMGLSAVAAALIYGYGETMALSDESKQYERMERIFNAALPWTAGPDLIEALGKEALAENGEWVLMHRERPVELPHA